MIERQIVNFRGLSKRFMAGLGKDSVKQDLIGACDGILNVPLALCILN